jgi:hypothetical protein
VLKCAVASYFGRVIDIEVDDHAEMGMLEGNADPQEAIFLTAAYLAMFQEIAA